jgi:very-short-patch-repair endonuclease
MNGKVTRARELRRESTYPEKICWELLRAHRMDGIKFRRQHPIGRYFVDFACVQRKLVIEIDGEHYDRQLKADASRTAFLESEGWRVLRFSAAEVIGNREGVWASIEAGLKEGAVIHIAGCAEGPYIAAWQIAC